MHCIIAYAACTQLPPDALEDLPLPRLSALLAHLQAAEVDRDPMAGRPPAAMPHERALARTLGWDTTRPLPWAAWQTGRTDAVAQAWITPCHWQIGMDQVFMLDPAILQLSEAHSQALLSAIAPYLSQDGLQVQWHDPLHWHARGALLEGWAAPSLDRVIGANVRPWITAGLPAALVRLHSEMQMLAYTHPVNEARLASGLLPVNAFWIHGAGTLAAPTPAPEAVQCLDGLRAPALQGNVMAWRAAWQALDAQLPAASTPGLQLTLCSDTTARHWSSPAPGWLARLRRSFTSPSSSAALKTLITE